MHVGFYTCNNDNQQHHSSRKGSILGTEARNGNKVEGETRRLKWVKQRETTTTVIMMMTLLIRIMVITTTLPWTLPNAVTPACTVHVVTRRFSTPSLWLMIHLMFWDSFTAGQPGFPYSGAVVILLYSCHPERVAEHQFWPNINRNCDQQNSWRLGRWVQCTTWAANNTDHWRWWRVKENITHKKNYVLVV